MKTAKRTFQWSVGKLLRVPITRRHVIQGIPESPTECMFALGMRDAFRAFGFAFPGHRDGVGFPLVKFTLGNEDEGPRERYTCVLLGESLVGERVFDEGKILAPFVCWMRVIHRRLTYKLGSRISRGLPPKAFSRKRDRERESCTAVRRYHQLKTPRLMEYAR